MKESSKKANQTERECFQGRMGPNMMGNGWQINRKDEVLKLLATALSMLVSWLLAANMVREKYLFLPGLSMRESGMLIRWKASAPTSGRTGWSTTANGTWDNRMVKEFCTWPPRRYMRRSEEHTSELQSQS